MTDILPIVESINTALPDMARAVIERHLDMSDARNQTFAASPDGREQHQTHWHHWGIITHTRMFLRHYQEDIPQLLTVWGLWDATRRVLDRPIDGAPRRDLLKVSILLHDIGKFAARSAGGTSFHFYGHETLSGEIIRRELDLQRYGLTPAQIEYVAETAEDHFVLGIVRKRAREGGKYDEAFLHTPEFNAIVQDIKKDHPDDPVEIGVLFLGDSLSKVDPVSGPPQAAGQHPINIALARRYLEQVLTDPSL